MTLSYLLLQSVPLIDSTRLRKWIYGELQAHTPLHGFELFFIAIQKFPNRFSIQFTLAKNYTLLLFICTSTELEKSLIARPKLFSNRRRTQEFY